MFLACLTLGTQCGNPPPSSGCRQWPSTSIGGGMRVSGSGGDGRSKTPRSTVTSRGCGTARMVDKGLHVTAFQGCGHGSKQRASHAGISSRSGTGRRTCRRCGRSITGRAATARWCSETCRVAAWHERRARAGLSGPAAALGSTLVTGVPVESQGLPVLRALCESWERAVDALAVPRRSDCEQALHQVRSAPRAALDRLETVFIRRGDARQGRGGFVYNRCMSRPNCRQACTAIQPSSKH